MDSTIIATSLPQIAQDLAVNPISLKLALTSYLVSLAVFIPISGWLADRFGARTTFMSAIAVFMLGSLFCALVNSLTGLVAARFLQGMGGAMMVPVGRLLILRTVDKSELVTAMSYLTIPALMGPVLGPPLGGLITTYFHWRWIFLINMPIGLVGLYMALRYIPNLRETTRTPLDWRGFVWSGLGLSLLMLGLNTLGRHLMSTETSLVIMVLGMLGVSAYLVHMRRTPHPLIDLSLMSVRTFRISVLGGSLFRIGTGAIPFLLPLMLQLGLGLNPFESGLVTCLSAFGAIFVKTIATRILRRYGFRRVLLINTLLSALGTLGYGLFVMAPPYWMMAIVLILLGCFRSLEFTSLGALSFADIEKPKMSLATGLSSISQQLAISLGVTIAAFALQGTSALQGRELPITEDFLPAFAVVALITAFSVWQFRQLAPDDGMQVSGHGKVTEK